MQLGNRIFPYPVLNQTKDLSEYNKDINFELSLQLDQNGNVIKTRDKVILKDICFKLSDEYLKELYENKIISCSLIVESASSIYRETFPLSMIPQTYEIPIKELKDDVYLSAYCYANCDIDNYKSDNFDEDYKDYDFQIMKYDIVAADDGMKFTVDRNLDEDNKVSSIFVIVKSESNNNTISYDMKSDKIYIYLPPKQHEQYNSLKVHPEWNDIFFSMMAIPVLTACFSEVKALYKSAGEDLQAVLDNYKWFRAVMKSYKKEKGRDLSEEDFDSIQPLDLAQIVFNYSSVNGIDKFYGLVNNVGGDEDE